MKSSLFFLMLVVVIITSACGRSSATKEIPLSEKTINGFSTASLDGRTFKAKCFTQKDLNNRKTNQYFRISERNKEFHFDWTITILSDNCDISVTTIAYIGVGSFTDNTLKQLRSKISSAQVSPLHYGMTEEFNKQKFCGFNNWQTYDWKNVLNTDCVTSSYGSFFLISKGKTSSSITVMRMKS